MSHFRWVCLCLSTLLPAAGAVAEPAKPPAAAAAPSWQDEGEVPVSSEDPSWGPREAPVTLVVFMNLECPFSRLMWNERIPQLLKENPEKLRVVWKHKPLSMHTHATPLAKAAIAVQKLGGQPAFEKFVGSVYGTGPDRNKELGTNANIVKWATAAGVSERAFRAEWASARTQEKLAADLKVGDDNGVKSTPDNFVNGRSFGGSRAVAEFQTAIDEEKLAVDLLVKKGTPANKTYAERCKQNRAEDRAKKAKSRPTAPPAPPPAPPALPPAPPALPPAPPAPAPAPPKAPRPVQ